MQFSFKDFCFKPKALSLDKDTIAIKWLFIYFGFMQKDSRYKWHHVLDIPDKERKD
jgi:hypothetical protein